MRVTGATPSRRGPLHRRAAVALLAPALVLLLAVTGVWLGLRVASPGEYETELGRVSVRVTPATRGAVEAYIPLADWGVRSHAFSAPMPLHTEPRTLQRDVVPRAGSGARAPLNETEAGLRDAVRR